MFARGANNTVRISRKVVDYTAKRLEESEVSQCCRRRALRLSHPVYELGSPVAIALGRRRAPSLTCLRSITGSCCVHVQTTEAAQLEAMAMVVGAMHLPKGHCLLV